jgi:hypothetical protein
MTNIKVFHFDDNSRARTNVDTYITAINEDYQDQSISLRIQLELFENADLLINKLKQKDIPEIIILDMYENTINVGNTVLNTIKELKLDIPTIIYTQGSKEDYPIDYSRLSSENPFIFGEEITKGKIDKLKDRIKEIIENKYLPNENLYTIDGDDMSLKAQIQLIGEQYLNKILRKVKEHLNYNQKFNLERISPGFSGAVVFKLKHENKTHILKISNNIGKLRNEYEKRKNYTNFPSIFRINIEKDFGIQSFYAILIENVHTSQSLFEWLKSIDNQINIENYFEKLYSNVNGLTHFYTNNKDPNEMVKFTQIFEIFTKSYAFVAASIKELKPLIDKYSTDFNESNIKNLILNGIYDKIDKGNLTGDKHRLLCHGDFHSNNIMIQGNDPIIIDTGGIKYDYWCMDICRLIVHLFIVGFDQEKFKYFDISKIPDNLGVAKKIITLDRLSFDDINNGYICAINWLINNVEKIYDSLYCKWEFQLGLCKEFLQMSYRVNSIPPNKRAIALLAAYKCISEANISFQNLL